MTSAQFELALLLIKGIMQLGERLDKVGNMTDDDCLAAIPIVQASIDANAYIIEGL